MENAAGNEVGDLPRFASRQYEQQIASLQNDCEHFEYKVRNRNWMIVGMIGAFALVALLVAVGLWTNVLTVDFSEDNLAVQLEKAKAELDGLKLEAEKLKGEEEMKTVGRWRHILAALFIGSLMFISVFACIVAFRRSRLHNMDAIAKDLLGNAKMKDL